MTNCKLCGSECSGTNKVHSDCDSELQYRRRNGLCVKCKKPSNGYKLCDSCDESSKYMMYPA